VQINTLCGGFDRDAYEQNVASTLGLQAGTEFKVTTDCASRRVRTLQAGISVTHSVTVDVVDNTPAELAGVEATIANLTPATLAGAASVDVSEVASFVVPDATISAFDAPSPPPPSPPPPSPPVPPMGCTLDFLRASSYYQNYEDTLVTFGPDGNLVHEFMEMERIMHEQYSSITTEAPYGSNVAYTCRVATVNYMYECLDIAAASTLQDFYGQNTFQESFHTPTGALDGNLFVHSDLMQRIATPDSLNVTNRPLFGMVAPCSDKIIGDGVVNGFDSYVIVAAQFGLGAYETLRDANNRWSPTMVETVQGRNDTKDRCTLANYNRLEWQQRVAALPCFELGDETTFQSMSGRRLQAGDAEWPFSTFVAADLIDGIPVYTASEVVEDRDFEPVFSVAKRAASFPKPVDQTPFDAKDGWSKFGLYSTLSPTASLSTADASASLTPTRPMHAFARSDLVDLQASVFPYAPTAQGTWYWINIPGIHAAMEITLLGAANDDPIGVTNIRAPNYQSLHTPQNVSKYELRFIRHREFYGLDTSECAVVQSSRTQEYAMEKGVLNIAQSMSANYHLCGFDLVLWKPAETPVHSADCEIRVEAGSIAMSAHGASMQFDNACAHSSATVSPPSPPTAPPPALPQPPLLPGWRYALTTTFTTNIAEECGQFDVSAYEHAVAGTLDLTVGTEFSVTTSCAQRRSLSAQQYAPSIEVTHTVILDFSVRDTDAVKQRINELNETAIAHAAGVNVDDVTPIVVAAYAVVPVDAPSPPDPPPSPPSPPLPPSLPPSSPNARVGMPTSAIIGIAAGGVLLLVFFAYLAVKVLMKDKPDRKLSVQTIEASASRLPLLCLSTPSYFGSNVEASDDRLESA